MKIFRSQTMSRGRIKITNDKIYSDSMIIPAAAVARAWSGEQPLRNVTVEALLCLTLLLGMSFWHPVLLLLAAVWIIGGILSIRKRQRGIHLELMSGESYSWLIEQASVCEEAYAAVAKMLNHQIEGEYIIDLTGAGRVMIAESEKESPEKIAAAAPDAETLAIIPQEEQELRKLYSYYQNKKNQELSLVTNEALEALRTRDESRMKKAYERFITQGAVEGCNELGLGMLIVHIQGVIGKNQ